MTHAEMLPQIKKENEEWREKYLPVVQRMEASRRQARKEALEILQTQLTPSQFEKVWAVYGY